MKTKTGSNKKVAAAVPTIKQPKKRPPVLNFFDFVDPDDPAYDAIEAIGTLMFIFCADIDLSGEELYALMNPHRNALVELKKKLKVYGQTSIALADEEDDIEKPLSREADSLVEDLHFIWKHGAEAQKKGISVYIKMLRRNAVKARGKAIAAEKAVAK